MFYLNWEEQIELMNDDELRRFINNLIKYHKDEDVELPTKVEKLTWLGIKPALETNNIKYEKKVKANQENGKLGGAPKGNKNASKSKTTQNNPNNPIKDNSKQLNDNSKKKKEKRENIKENWQKETGNSQLENENWQELNENREEIDFPNEIIIEDTGTSSTGKYTGVYTGTILLEQDIDKINNTMNTTYAGAAINLKDFLFQDLIKYKLQEKILETGYFNKVIFDILQKDKNLKIVQDKLIPEVFNEIEPLLTEYLKYI